MARPDRRVRPERSRKREEAHDHGIIHRDLKPPNVKVTPDDKVNRELHIHVFDNIPISRRAPFPNVLEAALLPAKSEDLRRAIRPVRTLMPGTWTHPQFLTANRTLVFPLSVLSEGNELHLRFGSEVSCTYFFHSHCTGRFDLKGVR